MATSYFTPDLAMGQIPRSTECIASLCNDLICTYTVISDQCVHVLRNMVVTAL